MLSFTGHSGQCDMTDSDHSSGRPFAISEVDKVINTGCEESKKYDKNNSDLLARAIHVKPGNLSYPNIYSVCSGSFCVFVCLCVCLAVCLCVKHCCCHSVKATLLISLLFSFLC